MPSKAEVVSIPPRMRKNARAASVRSSSPIVAAEVAKLRQPRRPRGTRLRHPASRIASIRCACACTRSSSRNGNPGCHTSRRRGRARAVPRWSLVEPEGVRHHPLGQRIADRRHRVDRAGGGARATSSAASARSRSATGQRQSPPDTAAGIAALGRERADCGRTGSPPPRSRCCRSCAPRARQPHHPRAHFEDLQPRAAEQVGAVGVAAQHPAAGRRSWTGGPCRRSSPAGSAHPSPADRFLGIRARERPRWPELAREIAVPRRRALHLAAGRARDGPGAAITTSAGITPCSSETTRRTRSRTGRDRRARPSRSSSQTSTIRSAYPVSTPKAADAAMPAVSASCATVSSRSSA